MNQKRPAVRCDYGVCLHAAVDIIETPAGECRPACRKHADRVVAECQPEVTR